VQAAGAIEAEAVAVTVEIAETVASATCQSSTSV
jgi:hypothetical protein